MWTILRSQSLNLHKRSDFKYKVLTLWPRMLQLEAAWFKDPHFTYSIKSFNPIAGISPKFLHRLSTTRPYRLGGASHSDTLGAFGNVHRERTRLLVCMGHWAQCCISERTQNKMAANRIKKAIYKKLFIDQSVKCGSLNKAASSCNMKSERLCRFSDCERKIHINLPTEAWLLYHKRHVRMATAATACLPPLRDQVKTFINWIMQNITEHKGSVWWDNICGFGINTFIYLACIHLCIYIYICLRL